MPQHESGIKSLTVYVGFFSKKDVSFKCTYVVCDYSFMLFYHSSTFALNQNTRMLHQRQHILLQVFITCMNKSLKGTYHAFCDLLLFIYC